MRSTSPLWLIVLVLFAPALSGCADKAAVTSLASAAPEGSIAAPMAASDPGARPNWTHGDWFTYKMYANFGFGTIIDNQSSDLVVTRADATGYEVNPAARDFGVVDAHFNDFFIGPVDPDLNGEAGVKKHFKMFQWPLKDGDSWTSDFVPDAFGEQEDKITFTAHAAPRIPDAKGDVAGFEIKGVSEKKYTVAFTYNPRAHWVSFYEKRNPQNQVELSMRLMAYGPAYKGTIHQVTREVVYEGVKFMPPLDGSTPCQSCAPGPPDTFTVTKDFTFLEEVVVLFKFGIPPAPGAPAVHVEIAYPDNGHAEYTHTGPEDFKFWVRNLEPYKKGTYAVEYVVGGLGGAFVGYYAFTDVVLEFNAMSHMNHGGA